MLRKKTDDFILESKNKYKDKYDYSLVEYKNNRTNVKIICKKHNFIYEVKPINHLNNSECPLCNTKQNMNNDIFILKSKKIHNNKYDYDLVDYKNNKTKIKIICLKHGIFEQRPNDHLNGQGCPECKKIKLSNLKKMTKETFVMKSNLIHENIYDYSLSEYNGYDIKIKIKCKKHGYFYQTPHRHLNGQGCPSCKMSYGEKKIENYLKKFKIDYIYQHKFIDCLSPKKNYLFFDFYLPKYNVCIEYDGEQHYKMMEIFGGEKRFHLQKEYDEIKNKYCTKNHIKLIRISYKDNVLNKLNTFLMPFFC